MSLHVNVKLPPGTIRKTGEWFGLMVCSGGRLAAHVFVSRDADYLLDKLNLVIGSVAGYHVFHFYL